MKKKIIVFVIFALSAISTSVYVMNAQSISTFSADLDAIVEKGNEFGPMCSQTGANGKYRMARCTTCNGYGYYDMDRVAFCR